MPFFEPLPPLTPQPPEPPQPPWIGPAENVLGVAVDLSLVLARTEDVGVGLSSVVAEPNGVSFVLDFRRRFGAFPGTEWGKPFPPAYPGESRDEEDFRFGVQFSDGRKATSLGEFRSPETVDLSTAASASPRLIPRGGGGGGRHASQVGYWVWPLPPPGPLAFVCEWRAVGIPLTRVEVDAAPIIAAARRATVLWALPDPDPASQGGWTAC
jgi:hypothetical protein